MTNIVLAQSLVRDRCANIPASNAGHVVAAVFVEQDRQQQGQLKKLGPVALSPGQHRRHRRHRRRHQQPHLQQPIERKGPQQAGGRQPGQTRRRAQSLGHQQRVAIE